MANWEAGTRRPSKADVAVLDNAYEAGGTLVGLCEALQTPAVFDADKVWWHHFARSSGPCWAWIRAVEPGRRMRFDARWGPLHVELTRRVGPDGLIIALPVSTPEPPVRFTLDRPGWVAFGVGRVPPTLHIPSLNVVGYIRPVWPAEPLVALFAGPLRPVLRPHLTWVDDLKTILGFTVAASGSPDGATREDLTPHAPHMTADFESQWSGERYRALREVRGLSRVEAASSVTSLSSKHPVTAGALETFEASGNPRVASLAPRLDVVYQGQGRTVVSEVSVTRDGTRWLPGFPDWWRGPVWMQATRRSSDSKPATIEITWGHWRKRMFLRPHAVIGTRKASSGPSQPTLKLPDGWSLRAGIGEHPKALAIDFGWWPATAGDARQILLRYSPVYVDLVGGNIDDLPVDHADLRRSVR